MAYTEILTGSPDPARSSAVLIGTSSYRSDELADLPAVLNNLDALATALTDPHWGGFPPEHCTVLPNHTDVRTVHRVLSQHANHAQDTLVVYFAGHGLTGPRRHELYLSLADTDPNELRVSALPFEWLREIFLDSPATNRILILDCCYSGRAVTDFMTSPTEAILGQTEIDGTYTIASTAANTPALAPPGATYTAFTGELVNLLRHGLPDEPELLTLNTIYRHLRHTMTTKGLPRPTQRGTGTTDLLALTRNPAHRRSNRAPAFLFVVFALILAAVVGVRSLPRPSEIILTGHTDWVTDVAFSPDGRTLATASRDATVRLWDVANRQPIGTPLTGHIDSVIAVTFSPDGRTLATASRDKMVRLWDVASRQPIGNPLTGHTRDVEDVAFSPDGRTLASASDDETVRLWDVISHRPLGDSFTGHIKRVFAVAFSPDGRLLATGGIDDMVQLWDVASRKPLGDPLAVHASYVTDVAFSPDGRTLAASGYDRTARLWDVVSRDQIGDPFTGHTDGVEGLALSPDGHTLATASSDQTVLLWDIAAHRLIGDPLSGHIGGIEAVTFSPDGHTLATASRDYTARLWNIKTG